MNELIGKINLDTKEKKEKTKIESDSMDGFYQRLISCITAHYSSDDKICDSMIVEFSAI